MITGVVSSSSILSCEVSWGPASISFHMDSGKGFQLVHR
jgi:hypothetical protein